MKILNSLADEILGDLKKEIPIPKQFIARKEKKGYTLFFNDSLKNFFFDNLSYKFLKEIDGIKNCIQIAEAIANSSKLPYLVVCNLLSDT